MKQIKKVSEFEFDPKIQKKGIHCAKFWPQFETLDFKQLTERIEKMLGWTEDEDQKESLKDALDLIAGEKPSHEKFLEGCAKLQEIDPSLEFYQTNMFMPGVILNRMSCCGG